jgi:hypothetical protein
MNTEGMNSLSFWIDTERACRSLHGGVPFLHERRMRAEIRAMPDGTYYGEDFVEGDGITDEIINFKVAITIKGDEMHLDWTGSHPQMPGPVNLVSCRTIGAAYVGLSLLPIPICPITTEGWRLALHCHLIPLSMPIFLTLLHVPMNR